MSNKPLEPKAQVVERYQKIADMLNELELKPIAVDDTAGGWGNPRSVSLQTKMVLDKGWAEETSIQWSTDEQRWYVAP